MRLFRRDPDPKLDRLAELPLFAGLASGDLQSLAPHLDEVDVHSGKVLMSEGRPGWEALVVGSGEASVTIGGNHVGSVGSGSLLGEMSLIGHGLRSATVTATTPMHLFVTSTRGFRALMDHPTVGARVREQLARHEADDAQRARG